MKNKKRIWVFTFVIIGLTLSLMSGCKKEHVSKVPSVTTTAVTDITKSTAASGGNVTSDGGSTVTARGVCWGTITPPNISDNKTSDGTGTGSFISAITGLASNTTYYVRAYATSASGTGYGDAVSFTTPQLPAVATTAISALEITTATGGGNVTASGGLEVTARGICWGTNSSPTVLDSKTTDGTGAGAFVSSLTGLVANTTYYVRAYATNDVGTAYGDEVTFTSYGLLDIDGNGYHSVVIGTQEWMKENLKTTTYSDGTAIPIVTDATAWSALSTGAYCEYDNASVNVATYGRLYNFYAVADAHLLCPTGWHVPDNSEWDALANQLGGSSVAGGKMKTTTLWNAPNTGATNESGFSGLPGGYRSDTFGVAPWTYNGIHDAGTWWTSHGVGSYADWRYINSFNAELDATDNYSVNGKSVRCLKD